MRIALNVRKSMSIFVVAVAATIAETGLAGDLNQSGSQNPWLPNYVCTRNDPEWEMPVLNFCALSHICYQTKQTTGSSCEPGEAQVCQDITVLTEWYVRTGNCNRDETGDWYCDIGSGSYSVGGTQPTPSCH